MAKIELGSSSLVVRAEPSKAIRTWFDARNGPGPAAGCPVVPYDIAWGVLRDSAELFGWKSTLDDLEHRDVVPEANGFCVRWHQEVDGIPVDGGEVMVNMYADGTVYSIYNGYRYDVTDRMVAGPATVTDRGAREVVGRLFGRAGEREVGEPALLYRHRPTGEYVLTWDVPVTTREPAGAWRVLIDARSAGVVEVIDRAPPVAADRP